MGLQGSESREGSGKIIAIFVVTPLVVLALFTFAYVGAERHFNMKEIDALVEGADKNGRSYELVIHNKLTMRYSFLPYEGDEQ